MKSSTKEEPKAKIPKVITFTKIKQWYLPIDAASYKLLRAAKCPMLRVHEDFIQTLRLITKPRGIQCRLVDFNATIMYPFFDELGRRWQKKAHRKAMITSSVVKFETTHSSASVQGKKALQQIESSLRRFFNRWGYSASFEMSEARGKCKLHVNYKYDSNKMPELPMQDDPAALPAIVVDLGYIRVKLSLGEKELEVNLAQAAGSGWTSMHTSRCLYSQVSDVRPMINALMEVVNKDEHNFDNRSINTLPALSKSAVTEIKEFAKSVPTEAYYVETTSDEAGNVLSERRVVGVSPHVKNGSKLVGNTTRITGDASGIEGDTTQISGDVTGLIGNVSCISGEVTNLKGIVTFLKGNVSKLCGVSSMYLKGDVLGLTGDISGLMGDVTNIKGDATGVHGDFSKMHGDISGLADKRKSTDSTTT